MSSLTNFFNNANNPRKLDLSKFGIIVNPQVENVFDLDAANKTCPNNSVKDGPCGKPRKLVFDIDDLFKSDSDSSSDSDSDSSSESESESDELDFAKLGVVVNRETVSDGFGDETDEVRSVYAFESTVSDSDEKNKVERFHACDKVIIGDTDMDSDDVESVYAFAGTEYDNDDVESVYAFDAANNTCLIDYGTGTADNGSVDETDEVRSVYAFESTGSDSDMNDKVEHVHPCDKKIVNDGDNSINKPDLSKVVNDNDDVESVYAFDALNETCPNDYGLDSGVDKTDVSDSAKDTPCDSKTAALKANTDAMVVFCELRPILDTVQMVGHIIIVVCLLAVIASFMTRNVLVLGACWFFLIIVLLGLIYNDFVSERLQECEKRLNLAPTKANSQAAKGNNADKHVIG